MKTNSTEPHVVCVVVVTDMSSLNIFTVANLINNFTVSARFQFGKTHRFDTAKTMSSSVSHTISFIIASVPFTIAPSKSILRRHITRAPMHIGNWSNILAHSFSSLEGSKLIFIPFYLLVLD
ncbi:unnamed protein product [Rotaria sp. Silwood2]|nr:unnamed protein product [Rotaria sp. Silwood2]